MDSSSGLRVLVVTPWGVHGSAGSSVLARSLMLGRSARLIGDVAPKNLARGDASVVAHALEHYSVRGALRNSAMFATGRCLSLDRQLIFRPTERLDGYLESFRPDVIYSHVGPLWMIELSLYLARGGYPVVTHSLDDYASTWPATTKARKRIPGSNALNRRMDGRLRDLFEVAEVRLTISEKMAKEYTSRYSESFEHIGHAHQASPLSRTSQSSDSFDVVFGGSVQGFTNRSSLATFISDYMPAISSSVGRPCRLTVFSDDVGEEFGAGSEFVSICPKVDTSEFVSRLRAAHLALLPMNTDGRSHQYSRLSWATKILDYFASGAPVLYLGRPDGAMGEFLVENQCGFVWGIDSLDDIVDAVVGEERASKAQSLLSGVLSPVRVREQFSAALARAVTRSGSAVAE